MERSHVWQSERILLTPVCYLLHLLLLHVQTCPKGHARKLRRMDVARVFPGKLGHPSDRLLYLDGVDLDVQCRSSGLHHWPMELRWVSPNLLQPVLHFHLNLWLQDAELLLCHGDALFDHVQVPRPTESLRPIGPASPARLPMCRRHPSFRHLLGYLDRLFRLRQHTSRSDFRGSISQSRCKLLWLSQHVQERYWRYQRSSVRMQSSRKYIMWSAHHRYLDHVCHDGLLHASYLKQLLDR